jgi:hypothetical protein
LDAAVEGAAADHLESDIGIAVVDPLPAAASGDDGKDNDAEAVDQMVLRRERHRVRLPMVRIDLEPLAFISRTASTGSRVTSCVFAQERGSLSVVENELERPGLERRVLATAALHHLVPPCIPEMRVTPRTTSIAATSRVLRGLVTIV